MRTVLLAVLAFVASGCTIHVVEQPAAPVIVAERHRPVGETSRPVPVRVTHPRPTPVAANGATAADTPRKPAPRTADRPKPIKSAPEPAAPEPKFRTTYRSTVDEPRSTERAPGVTTKQRRKKVKRAEPVTRVSSTGIAKAQ